MSLTCSISCALQPYYWTLTQAEALLAAFASDSYYTDKSSSSVAASLLCATPMIADQKLLDSYSYLTKVCNEYTQLGLPYSWV